MQQHLRINFFIVLFLSILPFVKAEGSQSNDTTATHISTLNTQQEALNFLQSEYKEYRNFLKEERTEHREHLQSLYDATSTSINIGLSVIGVIATILAFFGGWTIWKVMSLAKKVEKEAEERIAVQMRRLAKSNVAQAVLAAAKERMNAQEGRYLFLATATQQAALQQEHGELSLFKKALHAPTLLHPASNFKATDYQVIIYCSNEDDKGEDAYLRDELLPILNSQGGGIPLVVYTKGKWLQGETKRQLDTYLLHQLAGNPSTLIANTESAFRVGLLLESKKTLNA